MLKQLPKVLLLLGLLTAFVASRAPTFGTDLAGCNCIGSLSNSKSSAGCHFDKKTSQCIDTGCHRKGVGAFCQ